MSFIHVMKQLEKEFPTPQGVNHNLTMNNNGKLGLSLNVFVNDKWVSVPFVEEELWQKSPQDITKEIKKMVVDDELFTFVYNILWEVGTADPEATVDGDNLTKWAIAIIAKFTEEDDV